MALPTDFIIIGGGIAGLFTARELAAAGNRVTLLEATDRLGGRIFSLTDSTFDTTLELGAEFVHGDLPITMALLTEAGIPVQEVVGKRVFNKTGVWSKDKSPATGMNELVKKMNSLEQDLPFDIFLQTYYAAEQYEDLRHNVQQYARSFDLADTGIASTRALAKEWQKQEDKNYRVQNGYGTLVTWLKEKCVEHNVVIKLSSAVHTINWQRNSVQVLTATDTLTASKVILAVPVSMLQYSKRNSAGVINFNPPITAYQQAADGIGFGSVIKILLHFETAFWEEQQPGAAFFMSNQMIPTWWSQQPAEDNILTGWLGGPGATALADASEEILLKVSLQSLSGIFGRTVDDLQEGLKGFKIVDWSTMPFIAGGYSYASIHTADARKQLQQPIQDTIYFAGEAVYVSDAPGTVEAALYSASMVATSLL